MLDAECHTAAALLTQGNERKGLPFYSEKEGRDSSPAAQNDSRGNYVLNYNLSSYLPVGSETKLLYQVGQYH